MARVQFLLFFHTFNFRGLRSFDLVKNRVGSVWVRFSSERCGEKHSTTTVNMNLWFFDFMDLPEISDWTFSPTGASVGVIIFSFPS